MRWLIKDREYIYRAGFESFVLLGTIIFMKSLLEVIGVFYFSNVIGQVICLYISIWYYSVRKILLKKDCQLDILKRYNTRLFLCTIICTIYIVVDSIRNSMKLLEVTGTISIYGLQIVFIVSLWSFVIINSYKIYRCSKNNICD